MDEAKYDYTVNTIKQVYSVETSMDQPQVRFFLLSAMCDGEGMKGQGTLFASLMEQRVVREWQCLPCLRIKVKKVLTSILHVQVS